MALSPADFAAYSRATGTPYPETPEERAEKALEVREFRQNQLQQPSDRQSEAAALGLGIGLGLAGLGGAGLALRRGRTIPKKDFAGKSSVKVTDLARVRQPAPGDQYRETVGFTGPERPTAAESTNLRRKPEDLYKDLVDKYPDPGVGKDFEYRPPTSYEGQDAEIVNRQNMMITDPQTGIMYPRGSSALSEKDRAALERKQRIDFINQYPDAPRKSNRPMGGPLALINDGSATAEVQASRELARRQYASSLLDEKINKLIEEIAPLAKRQEGLEMGTEASRQAAAVRRLEREEEKQAKNILSELADETPTLTETYEVFGEPAAKAQSIDAVDTASDQLDSRFESTVQRDVDSVFEGKTAVAAEKLGVYGPLSAEDTAALARDQMIALRAELEAEGLRPGSTRFERALAERFKTGETTKIGELGVTGRSLEQVSLPAGPMRQTVQSVETSQSPTFSTRSVENVGGDPFSSLGEAASGTSIRGRSRVQNAPEQFRNRVDSAGRRIDDEFGVELTELDIDTGESRFSRKVVDPITGKLTPEFAPKGQRAVQLFQGEGQPIKTMYIPESDPGGIGIYGEERSFASGPISKSGENLGGYTKTAQRRPTELPYPQKKEAGLTSLSTSELQNFASNAVEKNPKAAKAAMTELERRQKAEASMRDSEIKRQARIKGQNPQSFLKNYTL